MNERLRRYQKAIEGTFATKHSANQRVAGLVLQGERLQAANEGKRTRRRLELAGPPIDENYLAAKHKRVFNRVVKVLAGYDGGTPEVFAAELRFLGLKL